MDTESCRCAIFVIKSIWLAKEETTYTSKGHMATALSFSLFFKEVKNGATMGNSVGQIVDTYSGAWGTSTSWMLLRII